MRTPKPHQGVGPAWVLAALVLGLAIAGGVAARRGIFRAPREPAGALRIEVIGHTWWWEFRYPDLGFVTANEMHIPVARPVRLEVRSADVIHSFWVQGLTPELTADRWRPTQAWIQAGEAGVYYGECKQLCGLNDANMRLRVVAEPPADFERWVASHLAPVGVGGLEGDALAGWRLFAGSAGCSQCHAIGGTPARGTTGPDLTGVGNRLGLGAMALVPNDDEHLTRWLRDPQTAKRGATMTLPRRLSEEEIRQLVAFLRTQTTYASSVVQEVQANPTRLVGTDIGSVLLQGEWRFDVPFWILVLAAAAIYLHGWQRLRAQGTWLRGTSPGIPAWRALAFLAGLAVTVVAVQSPVDTLSDNLLTFHMVQHELLVMVAAPLILLGFPVAAWQSALAGVLAPTLRGGLLPGPARGLSRLLGVVGRLLGTPVVAWTAFNGVMVLWHVPVLYNAAQGAIWVHYVEHAAFFLSALLFWVPVVGLLPGRLGWLDPGTGIWYFAFTLLVEEIISVWFLFSQRPIYSFYAELAQPWIYGLSVTADQQTAGAVMMAFGFQFALGALAQLARVLSALERRPGDAPRP